ncbi:MAG: AmmeMemoRadiSam system protein A [Butyrivibrio sp.]|nr:AmmeMemoRadiSam system protein A [Butyrivibrio sp.]
MLNAAFMVPHPPMIVPEVGRGGEKQIEETTRAYTRVADMIAGLEPETIIITSPHATMYSDYFHISPGNGARGSFSRFSAGEVSFFEEYDTELVEEISELSYEKGFPAGTLGDVDRNLDHGTMVPLWFVRRKYKGGRIVRIGLSGLPLADHYRLGMIIKEAIDKVGRSAVIIASGDLSHKLQTYGPYGYAPEGPVYDNRIMDVCERAAFGELFDFDEAFCEKAAECGHRSFVIMAGAFDGLKVSATRLSHQDVTGVGYGICTFVPGSPDEKRHFLDEYLRGIEDRIKKSRQNADPYVRLAYESLESYILSKKVIPVPEGLPEEMLTDKAGAFVSIHKQGKLRGCIGTIGPTQDNIASEIIHNAISASTRDPRFDPIRPDEIALLEVNVDVLMEPEDIASMDELDVKRYGVIVSSGRKRGLLLPDLDGVDTVEEQVSIAMQKGGITEDDDIHLQRFEVIRHT